ncbi:pickpocket protein 11 [Monomorium pharaonis]|uniref:pickpocket protein 11 n=1 Tax=Monomorium pharaonis TaxID=307658 RepID=UPI00102E1B74|nr:pickpocket protein 11 [Monomorium pharaonis]
MMILPHEDTNNIFKQEKNGLHCHNCYPDCEDFNYEVSTWRSYMSPGAFNTNLLWNYNITNEGVLHVYFSKYGTIILKQDVAIYWYEVMSEIGGICGVFIGFSFISVVELVYFFIFPNLLPKKSFLQEDDNHKNKILPIRNETIWMLHWNELIPQSWYSAKYGHFPNKVRH